MTVHNHGIDPTCRETTINGKLRGVCMTSGLCPECGWPTDNPACAAGTCNGGRTTPEPAPAYLDPLHDELDRLRTENKALRNDMRDVEAARSNATAALSARIRWLEEAEARIDQLTDELELTRDTLRLRSDAVNTVGATNDTLRATLARIDSTLRLIEPESITPQGARLIRAALADQETPA